MGRDSQRGDDVRDREWDSDTESVGGASDVEVSEFVEPTVAENPIVLEATVRASVRAFAILDAVNLVDLFDHRARVMRSVPHVLKGVFRMALRVAFQEIFDGTFQYAFSNKSRMRVCCSRLANSL